MEGIMKPISESRMPAPSSCRTKAEKVLWHQIINCYDETYFNPADEPLILDYIRWSLIADKAHRHIRKEGEIIDSQNGTKRNPWVSVMKDASTRLAQVGQKLRITPSSRVTQEATQHSAHRAAKGKGFNPKSDWRDFQVEPSVN